MSGLWAHVKPSQKLAWRISRGRGWCEKGLERPFLLPIVSSPIDPQLLDHYPPFVRFIGKKRKKDLLQQCKNCCIRFMVRLSHILIIRTILKHSELRSLFKRMGSNSWSNLPFVRVIQKKREKNCGNNVQRLNKISDTWKIKENQLSGSRIED